MSFCAFEEGTRIEVSDDFACELLLFNNKLFLAAYRHSSFQHSAPLYSRHIWSTTRIARLLISWRYDIFVGVVAVIHEFVACFSSFNAGMLTVCS